MKENGCENIVSEGPCGENMVNTIKPGRNIEEIRKSLITDRRRLWHHVYNIALAQTMGKPLNEVTANDLNIQYLEVSAKLAELEDNTKDADYFREMGNSLRERML